MTHKGAILNACLIVALVINVLLPSPALGRLGMKGGGGGGGSSVAEILAAGLITGLLMENRPIARPMIQALANPFMGGYSMMTPRYAMHAMMRAPMMSHYMMPTMHRPQYLMNHALMTQASHRALTARLNEEIRALEAQESILEAHLARYQQGGESSLGELFREEDTLPAAALLLETAELVNQNEDLDKEMPHPMHHPLHHPEMFETASSEPESRYLLPRIVRHFVQRLMRRGEHH